MLELLDRIPDAATLDVLLEPVNLLKLMLLHGWTEEDIRQQLGNGKIPGELLLELLEREPDPSKLLAQLGKPAMPARTAAASTLRTGSRADGFSPRVAGGIFVVCGIAFAIGVLLSLGWPPGSISRLQLVLLCTAPVLILMGVFQMITNKKILR
ncbi:MAG: hypothetical protein ACOYYS_28290 [Chloroflexota bacterium]